MLTRYGTSARGARARRSYDRIMDDSTWPRPCHVPQHPRGHSDPPDPGQLRGQPGQGMPGTGTGAQLRKTSPGGRIFIAHGRNHARQRRPREQGAARCPAPALRPRPWPSRRVTYHTMLTPACSCRLGAVLRALVSALP
jgi:hypothetical protein